MFRFGKNSGQGSAAFPRLYSRSCAPGLLCSCAGTNPATWAYRACFKHRETAMNIAKIMLAGTAALIISSATLAQQALNGTITGLNRINGTITIQQTQSGTVGANAVSAAQEFKVQDGLSLDDLHAGNRVTFSVTEKDGIKTITKLQKQ
jgi:Cu/Ag efflux protein CusF